jgi:hypothetical protein
VKAHLLTVLVIDFDGVTRDGVVDVLENARYPNHCIAPNVIHVASADIGAWRDDHPLNRSNTRDAEIARLFPIESRTPKSLGESTGGAGPQGGQGK